MRPFFVRCTAACGDARPQDRGDGRAGRSRLLLSSIFHIVKDHCHLMKSRSRKVGSGIPILRNFIAHHEKQAVSH
ncbi:hypothetical protein [Massilia sp. Se16.2.3]|uniref:hypothetical protein n=1 Tax=Massilia sp. Se16.2.3 TaxID=2709303 RepID=UPI001603348B|nr:hypothetical protein [Massilia sp. Se16.2.3]QNB00433.1 hypothetical protein G4G31_19185 [Massilia sp. Se16.2.3]